MTQETFYEKKRKSAGKAAYYKATNRSPFASDTMTLPLASTVADTNFPSSVRIWSNSAASKAVASRQPACKRRESRLGKAWGALASKSCIDRFVQEKGTLFVEGKVLSSRSDVKHDLVEDL